MLENTSAEIAAPLCAQAKTFYNDEERNMITAPDQLKLV